MKAVLVDGSFFMFRAWFAGCDSGASALVNARGEPTGALLTFLRGVMKVESIVRDATHLVVAMDTKRSELERTAKFASYKAKRPEVPAALASQLARVEEACAAFGWQCARVRGYEADDIINTYVKLVLAARSDATVHIFSPDKDLLQLVQPRVLIHRSATEIAAETDEDGVEAEWKVKPKQIGDFLALVGDASDNLPGVPGIGMVTAGRLLREHGTLERLLAAARAAAERPGRAQETLTARLVRNLVAAEEQVREIRSLVELSVVPSLEHDGLGGLPPLPEVDNDRRAKMLAFCEQEGFRSLTKQIWTRFGDPRPTLRILRVTDRAAAEEAMRRLRRCPGLFAVAVGPLHHCLSICAAEGVDLGGGRCLWLDLAAVTGPAAGRGTDGWGASEVMSCFADFFKDPVFKKVYHCFGDARRSLFPELPAFGEVDVRHAGLVADTMHMARLWNPALSDYSLEGLSAEVLERSLPPPPTLSKSSNHEDWPERCGARVAAILDLHEELSIRLRDVPWECMPAGLASAPSVLGKSMLDFYHHYWLKFGVVLSDLEVTGCFVDRAKLAELTAQTLGRCEALEAEFRNWARRRLVETVGAAAVAEAGLDLLSLSCPRHLQQLFFGTKERSFELVGTRPAAAAVPARVGPQLAADELAALKVTGLKELCKQHGLKLVGKRQELIQRLSAPTPADYRRAAKLRSVLKLPGLGIEPLPDKEYVTKKKRTAQTSREAWLALRSSRVEVLRADGLQAVDTMLQWREADKMLQFLRPLELHSRASGRVHSSFNLNTETGRLSSRDPNLQQMPAGFQVPVRDAIAAPGGRRLVVGDYSQLELRIVAHLANCRPMIELLTAGGDIHSATAYRMFEEVREAVDAGRAALDFVAGPGAAGDGRPLVKDAFPEQRKRAKVLNFSVLYGKTPWGLTKEWGVSHEEAEAMIRLWFEAYPEIDAWVKHIEDDTMEGRFARTVLGRIRPIRNWHQRANLRDAAMRKAVNSPVQGSAADIVAAAMVLLAESDTLRRLGFRQILQIHDEIVLEGPEAFATEAREEMVRLMENPLPFPLLVPLRVVARVACAWGDSK